MKARALAALALLGLLAGCASDSQPSNVENACAIFRDRPHWRDAVAQSEARWGAPAAVQLAIIWKESSFRPDAQPAREYALGFIPWGRRSSAYGFGQAIDGTWEWYQRETGNWGADRDDFEDAADFVGWYMARSARVNGIPMEDAFNHYIAYHEGHAGWQRGGWRQKSWLQRVAGEVRSKADEYDRHMTRCG
ncbi:MAG: transglycosylase SLT domain-containing protein [Pseudomonadota bacterium]